ncbi:MAG TPA: hypothetical protein DCM87_10360 [Planctomycetes bacterium]|nr:hypothetical protein [Planctomycetota bacterium]
MFVLGRSNMPAGLPIADRELYLAGGGDDVVVLGISADGRELVWRAVLGGGGNDFGAGIHVDAHGIVTVAGCATEGFPMTEDAVQPSFGGGVRDAFVVRLDPGADTPEDQLVFATLLGGAGEDGAMRVHVNAAGVITIAGFTGSSVDFPVTAGAFQAAYAGGPSDAFIARILPGGAHAALVYSTYIGGSSDDVAPEDGEKLSSWGMAVDANDDVVLAGHTRSWNFPVSPHAFDSTHNGGFDVFLVRLCCDASLEPTEQIKLGTYLGGTDSDAPTGIALDERGAIVVTGYTFSGGFPVTADALSPTPAGLGDGFLCRLDSTRTGDEQMTYSTFLGASGTDVPRGVAVLEDNVFCVIGWTESPGFPLRGAGVSESFRGVDDAFVAVIDTGVTGPGGLVYSTLLGGSDVDALQGNPVGTAPGRIVCGGVTLSFDFPATENAIQSQFGGVRDFIAAAFDLRVPRARAEVVPSSGAAPLSATLDGRESTTPEGTDLVEHQWSIDPGIELAGEVVAHTFTEPGRHVVMLTVANSVGHIHQDIVPVEVLCVGGNFDPWNAADIGSPLFPGSAWKDGEGISVCAGGRTTVSTADEFHYVCREISGDFSAVVRVEEPLSWLVGARLGLMVRSSMDPGAPFAAFFVQRYSTETRLMFRFRNDGVLSARSHGATTLPLWLKIDRRGGEIVASSSAEGDVWTEVDRQVIAFGSDGPVLGGLAACGNDTGDPLKSFTPLRAHVTGLAIAVAETFRRGDANASGALDIADAISVLGYLFGAAEDTSKAKVAQCLDAADANDDGATDIADAVKILGHLFADAGPLPAPFGECAADPTADKLDCGMFPPCAGP